jgi:hypothetical protein
MYRGFFPMTIEEAFLRFLNFLDGLWELLRYHATAVPDLQNLQATIAEARQKIVNPL